MVLHASEILNTGDKHPLIEELGNLVNKEKNPGIDAILEVTYNYQDIGNGKRYNTSLFEEYSGIRRLENGRFLKKLGLEEVISQDPVSNTSESREVDFQDMKEIFVSKAEGDIGKFQALYQKIENADISELERYGIGAKEKGVLLETVEHSIYLLELVINSIDFELEKAGFDHGLDDDEVRLKITENEQLEKKVFGGNILKNKKESEFAYEYLMNGWKRYQAMPIEDKEMRVTNDLADRVLTDAESQKLEGYIGRIGEAIKGEGHSTEFVEKKEQTNPTREFFKKFEHVQIPRNIVADFLQGSIDLHGMKQQVKVTSRKSPYDGPTTFELPDNELYEELDFERVCGMAVHEILAHYINQTNHEAGPYGDVRLSGNIEKEEGLAMLAEKTVKGLPVSGADVMNPSFIMVLASEIFSGEELTEFIDLYMDISERRSTPEARRDRCKRNYPDNYVGVQHKDVAYVRGLIRVAEYLGVDEEEKKGNIEDLFVGKVGLDSIMEGRFEFDEEQMLFPILNVEIMLFYIMNALGEENKDKNGKKTKKSHKDFIIHMKQKYKGIISEESFKKLEDSKLGFKSFKGMLHTIGPVINHFKEQVPANDNVSGDVRETLDTVAEQVNRLSKPYKVDIQEAA